jgi:voltage-dependent potassium channel beta subunit
MEYRRLGRSGLKLSALSFGSWVTFANQVGEGEVLELMAVAREAGVNFFDNAEVYAGGLAESLMGDALRRLAWPRLSYCVSTKFYWGISEGPNERCTLNRKYLLHGIDASLARLGLDYVDLVFCHRPDPATPIEETVWAMHDMIERGKALYWGTSEWSAAELLAAVEVAERYGLRKPVMEQPQYNLLHRRRVEEEYAPLYAGLGLGITAWSPLASGLLTGKYRGGIPADSRGALPGYAFLREQLTDARNNAIVAGLEALAQEMGCPLPQLAIAWCLRNPDVSTVILGASRREQLEQNLGALAVLPRLDAEVLARIDAITGGHEI